MSRDNGPAVDSPAAGSQGFSFIIVSYNTLALTRAAVLSINLQAGKFPHEIILVDNHSPDGSAAVLQKEFPSLNVLALAENRGFAAANNAGARVARKDWLVLLNSDAELLADTLPVLDDLLRRHPEIDVLGGQLLNADGSLQTSANFPSRSAPNPNEPDGLRPASRIIGAFMVIRRETWQKLDGMDEGFFFYGEEFDFCHRAAQAGACLRWTPRVRVLHHGGGSSKSLHLRAAVEFYESQHYYWRKTEPGKSYDAKIRDNRRRLLLRVIWYFALSVPTLFLLPAFTGRLRKYFHLFKWYSQGCPKGWGLRPVAS